VCVRDVGGAGGGSDETGRDENALVRGWVGGWTVELGSSRGADRRPGSGSSSGGRKVQPQYTSSRRLPGSSVTAGVEWW
jgi:hypothetical protein